MAYWLGTFAPQRVLLDLGVLQIYWYSFFIVLGMILGLYFVRKYYLRTHDTDKELFDVALYVIIGALIGARLWHVFIFQWDYYSSHLNEIIKIWEGGLAIHGGVLGGFIVLLIYSRLKKKSIWSFTDLGVLALPLGQAIGRWGNYFNQELYGLPTQRPWGIFIEEQNRIVGFQESTHFHPTFFYESVFNLILFLVLWFMCKKKLSSGVLTGIYLFGYGVIRFAVDFIRIDPMPELLQLRYSQWISLGFMALGIGVWIWRSRQEKPNTIAKEV